MGRAGIQFDKSERSENVSYSPGPCHYRSDFNVLKTSGSIATIGLSKRIMPFERQSLSSLSVPGPGAYN